MRSSQAKAVLVIAAARGIGRAVARRFLEEGWAVAAADGGMIRRMSYA